MAAKKPRQRPVSKTIASLITQLHAELKREHGSYFAVYVQVAGERVAEYTLTITVDPKVEK